MLANGLRRQRPHGFWMSCWRRPSRLSVIWPQISIGLLCPFWMWTASPFRIEWIVCGARHVNRTPTCAMAPMLIVILALNGWQLERRTIHVRKHLPDRQPGPNRNLCCCPIMCRAFPARLRFICHSIRTDNIYCSRTVTPRSILTTMMFW